MPDLPPDRDLYEQVFSALAHPARRRILMTLNFGGGSMSAGDIARLFAHSWPTTTRHMRVLEAAGLIHAEKRGRHRHYHLDREHLRLVSDWLSWFFKDPNGGTNDE